MLNSVQISQRQSKNDKEYTEEKYDPQDEPMMMGCFEFLPKCRLSTDYTTYIPHYSPRQPEPA